MISSSLSSKATAISVSAIEHEELRALHRTLAVRKGPLDQILSQHLKSSRQNTVLHYSLTVVSKGQHRDDYDGLIHFDAAHSFVLLYHGRPIAAISFIFCMGGSGSRLIRINQIQGVSLGNFAKLRTMPRVLGNDPELSTHRQFMKKGLARIDWEAALVSCAIFAERQGTIARVEIEPAHECNYFYSLGDIESAGYYTDSTELIAHNKRLTERYDRTAIRCGFALEEGIYVFKLAPS